MGSYFVNYNAHDDVFEVINYHDNSVISFYSSEEDAASYCDHLNENDY